ncbi:uncharacterized protein LOC126188220 [Schistocerca cancellata]|uniref:uncharacterized protein LOC126188220 n=1 Tax=Schistocerca cancellata TaxID=274614 RepID=UPI0021174B68|nr:uncharacterized protein LOC126188220 [Schistocerca cancellata]
MVCLGNQEIGYNNATIMQCDVANGMLCSADQATCLPASESTCCVCQEPTFTCHSVAPFPDPYDCQKYHLCTAIGQQPTTGSCRRTDAAYNPLTADCTLTTSDRVCTEGPIKPCTASLEIGVVPENPAIYYICKPSAFGFIPEMYKCPDGYIFDVNFAACVKSSTSSGGHFQQHPTRQATSVPWSRKFSPALATV